MNRNIGSLDRVLRLALGLALLGLTFLGIIGWWGLVGIVPVLTAIVGYCPVYPLVGVHTS